MKRSNDKSILLLLLVFVMLAAVLCFESADRAAAAEKGGGTVNISIGVNLKYVTVTPKLDTLEYRRKGGSYQAYLTWHSKKGYVYRIYRKGKGKYKAIGTRKAAGKTAHFTNRISGPDKKYTYTVKQIRPKTKRPFDKDGLTLMGAADFSVDYRNDRSVIKWKRVPKARQYYIYRTREKTGIRKRVTKATGSSYTDKYSSSWRELKDIMHLNHFIDPAIRDISYNVRPVYSKQVGFSRKVSRGLMMQDGDVKLEPPVIVGLEDRTLEWGTVPNAEIYRILKKDPMQEEWETVGIVKHDKRKVTLRYELRQVDKDAYYAVRAEAHVNGERIQSETESGFTLRDATHDDTDILFIGDSITYGALYKSESNRHIFSYPNRIHQLTGAEYYSPSIPGATYHYQERLTGGKKRHRIVNEVVEKMQNGECPNQAEKLGFVSDSRGRTNTKIQDYDIVVLAAGTNDYIDDTEMGEVDSREIETFCGSVNSIMEMIKAASQERITSGKDPIKVVFVDLFYSERCLDKTVREDRDTTENAKGYTLTDYQDALNSIYDSWAQDPELSLYRYKTRDADIVNKSNIRYMTPDNLHFTKYAYALYGNSIAEFLMKEVF